MKAIIRITGIILFISLFYTCSKNDDSPVNHAPGSFEVTTIPSGNSVTINWTEAIDPDEDEVYYNVLLQGDLVLEESTLNQFIINDLDFETNYSGKVIVKDPQGLFSETDFSFTTGAEPNEPPSIPQLISPTNNMTDVSILPELQWTASVDPNNDSVVYDVYLDTNPVPTTIVFSDQSAINVTFTTPLDYETSYHWKIVAKDGNGGQTSGETFSFVTKVNEAPTNFELIDIANGSTGVELLPEFSWEFATDPEGGAVTYDVYVDTNSNPSALLVENLTATSYQTTIQLNNNTTYYWKVVAKDPEGIERSSAAWWFTTRDLIVAQEVITTTVFADRAGHSSVVFDGKMWVIGGVTCCGGTYADIWSSDDGESWTLVTDSAPFGARRGHEIVVFDNKLWLIGGRPNHSGPGDGSVWNSVDGINWTMATNNTPFGGRFDHRVIAYNGAMWLFGGQIDGGANSTTYRQVFNSTDGINWNEVEGASLHLHKAEFTEYNGRIYSIGNYNHSNVYSTIDGLNWTTETEDAPFGQRHNHTITHWDNKLWLMSGSDKAINEFNELPDVWFSEDGSTWQLAAQDAGYTPVAAATSVVYDDKIWIIGGGGGWQSSFVTNEIWFLSY